MSNIVAIIPARSGSKGVPDKNIRPLAGKPLIAYSIRAAKKASRINRVFVSTDSVQYAEIATHFGAEVPFLRPVEISNDTSSDYDFMAHFLSWLAENDTVLPEYIIHLRPTTPLRKPSVIDAAIELMLKSPESTSLRSVHMMAESAYKSVEMIDGLLRPLGKAEVDLDAYNRPRQSFPDTYNPNGYIDVLKTAYIQESKQLHGNQVLGYVTPVAVEVDTLEDMNYLEYQISKDKSFLETLFSDGNEK